MKKRALLTAVLLIGTLIPAFAAGVELQIRFYNKKVYYAGSEPVYVQVTLNNNSPELYRFRMAEDHVFTLDFDVRSLKNRPVEAAPVLLWRRGSGSTVFFREITVEPGESFSFVEDLRDYARLDEPGNYVVQARLYPEMLKNVMAGEGAALVSPRLNLSIRQPLYTSEDGLPQALDVETNAVLVRERLPPDEVVSFMLTARQKSQWEKFFLYIDLEQMLRRDGARERRWRAESEQGRRRMLEQLRADMQSAVIDGDIQAIPLRFEIERTTYSAGEGTVVVLERFKQGDYIEKKRYTYHLRKYDEIWTVVDYVVVNLGTE